MMQDNWQWLLIYPAVVLGLMETLWIISRKRPGFGHKTAIIVRVVVGIIYLIWRIFFTIPTDAWWNTATGVALLTVEVIGFAQSMTVYATLWRPSVTYDVPLPPDAELPSVDVFIATYNEPVSMLRMTIAGAVGMRYPSDAVRIYVCDDGGRDEVRLLAQQFGVTHLVRADHAHAKAGNLNNTLGVSNGELIVTLDADMVPRPDFLERTVGRFQDADLGFVQAPQAFYNEDPFQYNLFSGKAIPNEQDFFMRTLQAGKSRFNAIMYVGSNTVFRREALESIGGFATGVITEDLATGMLVQAAGYRSEFVPEVIAAGLAPENLADMLKQRDRWCRGNIQTTRKWNPLTWPGLSPMQRWLYSDAVVYWYFGVFKMVYIMAPILYLLFGITALDTSLQALIIFWVPSYLSVLLTFGIVAGRRRSHSWSNIYELALTPAIAFSAVAETIGLKVQAFNVTPKGVGLERRLFHWRIALPHLVLLALSAVGLVNVFFFSPQTIGTSVFYINVFWCLYFVFAMTFAVALCVERPRLRSSERTQITTGVSADFEAFGTQSGELIDLSLTGARISIPWAGELDATEFVTQSSTVTVLDIPGVGAVSGRERWITTTQHGVDIGFEFATLTSQETVDVVRTITQSPNWVRGEEEEKASLFNAGWRATRGATRSTSPWRRSQVRISSGAQATLRPMEALDREPKRTRALQLRNEHDAKVEDIGFGGCRLTLHERLDPGSTFVVDIPEHLTLPEVAEVRWVKRRGRRFEAGLQFQRAGESIRG